MVGPHEDMKKKRLAGGAQIHHMKIPGKPESNRVFAGAVKSGSSLLLLPSEPASGRKWLERSLRLKNS
jgi:hypothetical protein